MSDFSKYIENLYPHNVAECMESISSLLMHYKEVVKPQSKRLSSSDMVLIAYADSFLEKNKTPLQSLKRVMDKYLFGALNSIHILPFYPFTSDDGFSVVDYKKVESSFGDWDDIENLGNSYQLMFDAVINHISKSSEWFRGFQNGDEDYEGFFISEDPNDKRLKRVTRPRTLPLLHPFMVRGREEFIWTTFSEDQLDLNYSNYKVFLRVLDVLLFYVANNARFIRLDAVAFLWKKLGTECVHLDETHQIIKAYRAIINELAPQCVFITETNVPHHENISYFGSGNDEAHMVYNFSLPPLLAYSVHKQDVKVLAQWAESLKLPSEHTCFFNFTASHDGIGLRPLSGIVSDDEIRALAQIARDHGGFVSEKSNPDGTKSPYELNCSYIDLITHPNECDEIKAKRFLLTQSVMLTMPGIPAVYYHSVFGSVNDREAALSSGINRRINRAKLQMDRLEEEFNEVNSLRSLVYRKYIELLKIRKSEEVFEPYGEADFFEDEGLFVIERRFDERSVYCVHNFTSSSKNISKYLNGTKNITCAGVLDSQMLKPFSFIWLAKK